MTRSNSSGRNS